MVSSFVDISLIEAIDTMLGTDWWVIARPLPPEPPMRQSRPSSYLQRGREMLAEMGWQPAIQRLSSPTPDPPPASPGRERAASATERFVRSDLFHDLLSGKLVIEATPRGSHGAWSEAAAAVTLPSQFWERAKFRIHRNPPTLVERIPGRKPVEFSTPMVRLPEAKNPPPSKEERGAKGKRLAAAFSQHQPELVAMPDQKTRAVFLAEKARCSPSLAKQFLQDVWKPET